MPTMADLDFSNYQGPVKNPFAAAGGPTLITRTVNRINVSREAVVTVKQVEVLVQTAKANDQISHDLVEQIEDQFPPRMSFHRIPGIRKPESIDDGHLAEVLAAAMQILHEK
jgi:hypothetical protein